MTEGSDKDRKARSGAATLFQYAENAFYVVVAAALAVVGAIIFGNAIYLFISGLGKESLGTLVLELLDQLLLVFIVAELIHTVRAVISDRVLLSEPFLIVGIVASIRRLIVVTAEVPRFVGTEKFGSLMLEIGVLVGAVLAIGLTIFLLRHTEHPEPRPREEPEPAR